MYVTDDCVHEAHISDFVSMGCGCYARMTRAARADAAAHDAWQLRSSLTTFRSMRQSEFIGIHNFAIKTLETLSSPAHSHTRKPH
jgi:hypothetical protein